VSTLNTSLGEVPQEQKMLKGHLPRVVYRRQNGGPRVERCSYLDFICSEGEVRNMCDRREGGIGVYLSLSLSIYVYISSHIYKQI
jgi:hypothetical protein